MAIFNYKARSRSGEKSEGTVEANDRRGALLQIEKMGLIPVSVVERGAAKAEAHGEHKPRFTWLTGMRLKMSGRETLTFTTELSDLLASGMKLGNALNCLASRKAKKAGDKIIAGLRDEIIQGASLSEALAHYPESFSNLYVSMIKAGEASGAQSEVLKRLVSHYERIQETKEKVVMALVYPLIVVMVGIATMIFCMVWVVPKFKVIFDQMGSSLPLPTKMLIGGSKFIAQYGIFLLAGIVILAVMVNRWVKTKHGRLWWHGVMLKMPLVKGVVACGIYANFARTLSTLLANGVPVLQALGIVERTVGNEVISNEIKNAKERVTDGTTISKPLAAGKIFPEMMTDMLAVGEQTGDMPRSLNHIAHRYEGELERNIKIFTTALEPILMVLVAVGVGFVAISILMAVFNLTSGMGG